MLNKKAATRRQRLFISFLSLKLFTATNDERADERAQAQQRH